MGWIFQNLAYFELKKGIKMVPASRDEGFPLRYKYTQMAVFYEQQEKFIHVCYHITAIFPLALKIGGCWGIWCAFLLK